MKRKRRRFSGEFKETAVRELEETGATLAEVSARLGVSIGNLSQWRTQLGGAAGTRRKATARPAASNSSEIEALLKEIEQLKDERDTLRKALSYLAKDL